MKHRIRDASRSDKADPCDPWPCGHGFGLALAKCCCPLPSSCDRSCMAGRDSAIISLFAYIASCADEGGVIDLSRGVSASLLSLDSSASRMNLTITNDLVSAAAIDSTKTYRVLTHPPIPAHHPKSGRIELPSLDFSGRHGARP